jgi:glutamine amidotransferase
MIAIIDYQMGNLRSVQKAFERLGHEAVITDDPAALARADRIVLPGVGAFCDAMAELARRGFVAPIREEAAAGKPILGVCLGLQLFFDVSYEDGEYEGLGLIPGKVVRFDASHGLKIPHMGWNQITIRRRPPILEGIEDGAYFYFVHSYYGVPENSGHTAATTDYPLPFCSIAWKDNLYATQFHPEKSQQDGLRLLDNFARRT